VAEVEFSAEDAGRTDIDFLCKVCHVAVDAGATVLNLPDTVGYAVPEEYGAMFTKVREVSGRCARDYAQRALPRRPGHGGSELAGSDSRGVRQIECTINGIGERAGKRFAGRKWWWRWRCARTALGYDGHPAGAALSHEPPAHGNHRGAGGAEQAIVGANAFAA